MSKGEISRKSERGIVAAACQAGGVTLSMPAPARHHDILWSMDRMGIPAGCEHQGFIDHRGVFVGREAAMIVANNWGQFKDGEFVDGGELYSEHLW